MWLYEDLLNEKPKVWLRAKRNRELRKEKGGQTVEVDEGDKLLTPEEIKAKRLKRQLKEWKDRWLVKEKQWMEEWNAKYWLDIARTYVYLKEDFWAAIAETYHEIEEEGHLLPDISMSENDLKDRDYILRHKYDWFYDWSRFGMSRFNWYVSKSNARNRRTIWSPIKLIPTMSLQSIYTHYIDRQIEIWNHLQNLANVRGMSVPAFVRWGFREEDIIRGRRGYWRSRRATFKPREGSWLDDVIRWVSFNNRITAIDYIRMIYEGTFMLSEACIPFNTYVVGDYVLFGNKACAVPSMFGNWEFFNEENRETIHRMARYALRVNPDYNIANKVPIFNWENMRLVKVSSEKISDWDEVHNNWSYSFYLVPPTDKLWNIWNKDVSFEQVIDKFKTPDVSVMDVKDAHPKTDKDDLKFTRKLKQNIFYFNTDN